MEFNPELPSHDGLAAYYWPKMHPDHPATIAHPAWASYDPHSVAQHSINPLLIVKGTPPENENEAGFPRSQSPVHELYHDHNYHLLSQEEEVCPPRFTEPFSLAHVTYSKSTVSLDSLKQPVLWIDEPATEQTAINHQDLPESKNAPFVPGPRHSIPFTPTDPHYRPWHKRTVSEPVFGAKNQGPAFPKVTMKERSDSCLFDAEYWSNLHRFLPVPCEENAPPAFTVSFAQTAQELEKTSQKLMNYLLNDYDLVAELRQNPDSFDQNVELSSKRRKVGDDINWKPMSAGSVLGLNEIFKLHQREVNSMLQNCTDSCFGELNMRELRAWKRGDRELKRRHPQVSSF
ncbi:hypothetical protein KL930_003309 [Ogataea haglerorum]|uniref:Uncharacterized protein n=1 Tax=Ogataea haglerorum TaxID=1937702 RepID=A0AAN6HZI6_9ASCO|nr:uncharacterized protein KL911_002440 [Ogataea haglerorum]KAG7696283.1 hypothetical protein KL915_002647 [Ogataea haglerorum]KAG7696655.1 hypothetical protein KL951_003111 [Ogataea haglerorum]KAG7706901.1 hypothetical protein KL914_002785 [Ogataea haglerorum]KAG7708792.1 hypothetical protein KL950_002312 [Ogataea haglerorum]KAG7716286.1 hypothetical protein KL913_003497 [Ogataea haglerorum]